MKEIPVMLKIDQEMPPGWKKNYRLKVKRGRVAQEGHKVMYYLCLTRKTGIVILRRKLVRRK